MKPAKRFFSLLLSLCLFLSLTPGTAFAAGGKLPFSDVNAKNWYHDAVQYVYGKGMMGGTSATSFAPDATTSRGMIVTVLHRMEGAPAASGTRFTDVPSGQWYTGAVKWASANGIVGGYGDGRFGPDDPITREQMASILYRYSQYKEYDLSASGSLSAFPDAGQTSSYARDPMQWAVGSGLIAGVNGRLTPKGSATRAQVATILQRYCEAEPVIPPEDEGQATGEELVKAAEATSDTLRRIEEPFRDKSGHVAQEDWPKLLKKLDDWGKQAIAEGKLLDYASSKSRYTVTIQDTTGLVMCYTPPIQALEEYAAGTVQTYEPYYGVDETFEKAKKKYGTIDQAAEKIKALGYHFDTNADGKDVTFDTLKQWQPGGVILWQGHGLEVAGGFNKVTSYFGALATTMKLKDHSEEFASYTTKGGIKEALVVTDENGNIAVTPNFFDRFYRGSTSLKGSLIWLGSCYSAYQDGFASVFQKKGANLIIGSPGKVDINYVVNLLDKFVDALTSENGTKYSAQEALKRAKRQVRRPKASADMIAKGDDFWLSATAEAPTVSLSGVVQDDVSKEAVKGAVVSINGVNLATTDAFGKFTGKVPEDKPTLSVTVLCNGYEDYSDVVSLRTVQKGWTISLTPAGKGSVTLPIRLEPDQGKISSGSVAVYELTDVKRNEDGSIQGINGTGNFISSKKLIKNVRFYKDTFEINGLETNKVYSLEIAPEGYHTEKLLYDCWEVFEETPIQTEVVKVTAIAQAKRSFTLTVTDQQTGTPLSDAAVTLSGRSKDTEAYQTLTSGSTNAKGMFQADVDGKYTDLHADVVKDGYSTGSVETTKTTASLALRKEPGQAENPKPSDPSDPSDTPVVPEGYTPIYTFEDLEATKGSGNVVLMNDIVCPEGYAPFTDWNGVMEGNGHSISNLKPMNAMYDEQYGGWLLQNQGIIRNVQFKNANLTFTNGQPGIALIAENRGTVENCTLDGRISVSRTVDVNANLSYHWASGFAIINYSSGKIIDCINRASVTATAHIRNHTHVSISAAGICTENSGTIEHCLNLGNIAAEAQGNTPPMSMSAYGIDEERSSSLSQTRGTTSSDCGNAGNVTTYSASGTTTETTVRRDPISKNATGGFVTDSMGKTGYTVVSRSELLAKWPNA